MADGAMSSVQRQTEYERHRLWLQERNNREGFAAGLAAALTPTDYSPFMDLWWGTWPLVEFNWDMTQPKVPAELGDIPGVVNQSVNAL